MKIRWWLPVYFVGFGEHFMAFVTPEQVAASILAADMAGGFHTTPGAHFFAVCGN